MRRREFLLVLGSATTAARGLRAQQKTIPVIGYLDSGSRNSEKGSEFVYDADNGEVLEYAGASGAAPVLVRPGTRRGAGADERGVREPRDDILRHPGLGHRYPDPGGTLANSGYQPYGENPAAGSSPASTLNSAGDAAQRASST